LGFGTKMDQRLRHGVRWAHRAGCLRTGGKKDKRAGRSKSYGPGTALEREKGPVKTEVKKNQTVEHHTSKIPGPLVLLVATFRSARVGEKEHKKTAGRLAEPGNFTRLGPRNITSERRRLLPSE